ncbi:ABC transporter ATP-binding protein [Peribacillus alkalitolerans]|uniref:ABC transporter ATP-binding protein n=1 Tax=Peribacillus alkalitolerans TaxID=1550385 RepID=UPI0013CFD575|nr:ABC transporter ATP-binding protein [Peribacillus alkalitolerans]
MALLHVSNLSKAYKGNRGVNTLSFTLDQGKCIALIGPNGAGKTTTLRMLAGLLYPSTGKIEMMGMEHGSDIRAYIGYLPQFPVFYDWMTGFEFLIYAAELTGMNGKEATYRAEVLMKRVGLEDAKKRKIGKYSGGMKQRLGIAQAIIHKPKLLMLDEPVSALDPFGRREVLDLLLELKQEMTILFSTHILNDAEEICEDVLFLHDGNLVEQGSIQELKEKNQVGKIKVEASIELAQFVGPLNDSGIFNDIIVQGKQVICETDAILAGRKTILGWVLEAEIPVVKMEVSNLDLEDLFMKVVKQ